MKIVLLMVFIFVLISFFGTAIVTLITWFANGGSMVVSTLGMFTDFFSRALNSMFNQPYIQSIFAIFLFCTVILIIISFLRGVIDSYDSSSVDSEEIEFDTQGNVKGGYKVKTKNKTYKIGNRRFNKKSVTRSKMKKIKVKK